MGDEMRWEVYMIPGDFCVVYHYFVDMVLIRFRMLSMICLCIIFGLYVNYWWEPETITQLHGIKVW